MVRPMRAIPASRTSRARGADGVGFFAGGATATDAAREGSDTTANGTTGVAPAALAWA